MSVRRRLLKWATRLVNTERGENNSNPNTNGEFALLRRLAPQLQRVVDAGAHRGDWAGHLLGMNPGVKVVCVEPHPQLAEALNRRFVGRDVRVLPIALGRTEGKAELHVFDDAFSEGHSLYRRDSILDSFGVPAQPTSLTVPMWTVGRVLKETEWDTVCYLKLDVEGQETEVLRGAVPALEAGWIEAGQFEYGGTYIDARALLKDAFEILLGTGYKIFLVMPRRLRLIPRYDSGLENFQFKTFAFFHEGSEFLKRCNIIS